MIARAIFKNNLSIFDIVTVLVIATLMMTYSMWWLALYPVLLIISTAASMQYQDRA
jgi:hypothetical protein